MRNRYTMSGMGHSPKMAEKERSRVTRKKAEAREK